MPPSEGQRNENYEEQFAGDIVSALRWNFWQMMISIQLVTRLIDKICLM